LRHYKLRNFVTILHCYTIGQYNPFSQRNIPLSQAKRKDPTGNVSRPNTRTSSHDPRMLPSSPLTPTLHRPFLVTSSSFSSAVLSSPKSPSFNSSAASASSPRRRLSTFPPDHVPSPTPRRTMSSTLAIQGAVPLLGGEGEKTLLRDLPGAGGGGQGPAPVDDLKEAVAEVKSVIGKKISRSPAGPNVNPLAIIASMLAVSNGRDKVLVRPSLPLDHMSVL
jgi:hypothetical protein